MVDTVERESRGQTSGNFASIVSVSVTTGTTQISLMSRAENLLWLIRNVNILTKVVDFGLGTKWGHKEIPIGQFLVTGLKCFVL